MTGPDGDDGRIFLEFKFSIPGFFWVRNFGKCYFWVAWFKKGFFLVIQNNLTIRGFSRVSRPLSSEKKVDQTLLFVLYHLLLSGNFYGSEIRHGG